MDYEYQEYRNYYIFGSIIMNIIVIMETKLNNNSVINTRTTDLIIITSMNEMND